MRSLGNMVQKWVEMELVVVVQAESVNGGYGWLKRK